MNKADVLAHYENNHTKVAEAIGITRSAVSQWSDRVPLLAALELERVTKGKLRVDMRLYKRHQAQAA